MDPTFTDRSFQDSPGKYLEESRPRNRSKTTWTSPRGASCRPDSNRRAWPQLHNPLPQAPGAGGRGVPKTRVQAEASAALCVCGRAGCWEGRAHVRKRGIAWRGANGARAVGAPPPAGGHRVWEGEACGLASSSPRAVLSWIAHARLRVRSTDLTCVRRASPRPRASASSRERNCSAKPPVLRRGSRLRCTRPEAASVSQQPAVARPLSGSRI